MRKKVFINLIIVTLLGVTVTFAVSFRLMAVARADISLDRSDPFNDPYIAVFLVFFLVMSAANIFIILFLIHNSVIKGIKETLKILKRVSEGEEVRVDVRSCKEFEELSGGINLMLDTIKDKIDETLALNENLGAAKLRAENANRAKSAFFASVSHEIRTPMNAVIGMSELLSEDEVTDRQLDKIKYIKTYSNILLGIIDDLLDFSEIEDGSFRLTPEHYNFPALLDNIAYTAKLAAQEKGLEFIPEFSAELPEYILGDAAKLRQALMNLLSNAVKFTEKGKVTFAVRFNESALEFSVSDTGTGIKPEDCERLFVLFKTAEERKATGLFGIGLGLTITDNIVRMMNGKLTVESIYNFGSTFRVEIPFEAGSRELAGLDSGESTHVSAPEAKVLIVDDIDVNLTVGIGFLKLHDIIPDIAASAKEAIKLICEKDYDIVFMDHMMPETDGVKASEIIRSFGGKYAKSGDNSGGLKIIALTASVTSEAKKLMLDSGMDDFLPKPVTKSALNRMLLKWLPPERRTIKIVSAESEIKPENYPPFLKAAEKINGLDITLGLRRSGGTAQAFGNSLKLLYRRIPKSLSELERYLKDRLFAEFAVEVHGMKGALAINGLEELSRFAAELEAEAKSENAILCTKKLPNFTKKLKALEAAIGVIFPEDSPRKKQPGSGKLLREFIDVLMIDIERFDRTSALREIEQALEFTFDGKGGRLFELLKADLEDYDYDSAMEKLQNFENF
jgi:signal transduction histidine kinase/CheY-like chemotaxis protein/HPt (histidine-containing phosphotransfer) domain-containing protein